MERVHTYRTRTEWTGNRGAGTDRYDAYDRAFEIRSDGRPPLLGSADPAFRGDPARWNPEELLVASLSSCHMLWYLHLCAVNRIRVVAYADAAEGRMREAPAGDGRFEEIVLHPRVVIASGDPARAHALHDEAHAKCFIAASVSFSVRYLPEIALREAGADPISL